MDGTGVLRCRISNALPGVKNVLAALRAECGGGEVWSSTIIDQGFLKQSQADATAALSALCALDSKVRRLPVALDCFLIVLL